MMIASSSFVICYVDGDINSLRFRGSVRMNAHRAVVLNFQTRRIIILELTIKQNLRLSQFLSPPLSREGGGSRCRQGIFPSFVKGGGDGHRHQGIVHCRRRRHLLSKGGSGNFFCVKARQGPVAGTARRQRCNGSSGVAPSPSKNRQIHSALTSPDAKKSLKKNERAGV
jgi:hypothetical protein